MSRDRDEFHRQTTAFMQLRAALRDPTTELFAYSFHFDRLHRALADRPRLGVLWIGVGDRRLMESVYGWEAYDALIARAAQALERALGDVLPDSSVLAVHAVYSDALLVFCPCAPDGRDLDSDELNLVTSRLETHLVRALADAQGLAPEVPFVRVGASFLSDHPFHRFERSVHHAVGEARQSAERPHETERLTWLSKLQELLVDRAVEPLFQPVVEMSSGQPLGLEAYSRAPNLGVLRLPRVMFWIARTSGQAIDVDRLCRKRILDAAAGFKVPSLLFLNTLAESLGDPAVLTDTPRDAELAGLPAERIVLEVTEGQLDVDVARYQDAVQTLRERGFLLCLDDVGSGPRTSEVVEALRPDFLKLDVSVARAEGQERLRAEVFRSVAQLARRAGARLIAKKVETSGDREALLRAGIREGQGYLFGREMPIGELGLPGASERGAS